MYGNQSFQGSDSKQLNVGQKMLGEMAYTLLRSPSVLFLDEPMLGLAVDAKQKVMQYLKELHCTGKVTVLYTGTGN